MERLVLRAHVCNVYVSVDVVERRVSNVAYDGRLTGAGQDRTGTTSIALCARSVLF